MHTKAPAIPSPNSTQQTPHQPRLHVWKPQQRNSAEDPQQLCVAACAAHSRRGQTTHGLCPDAEQHTSQVPQAAAACVPATQGHTG